MDFKLNSEQQLLKDSVRRFVDKACGFEARAAMVKARAEGSAANWNAYAENGWLAAALPEEYGGLGGTLLDTALISQELGRALPLEPWLGCAVLGAQTLVAAGTPAQKDSLLPAVADGSCRIALAYSEPQSRGMAGPVALQARRTAQGYELEGRKSLVLGGRDARMFIVSASADDAKIPMLLLVDGASAGLTREVLPLHDGTWAAELVFERVQVGPTP